MLIQIAGITGMLGSAVSEAARRRGHAVTATGDITQMRPVDVVAPVVINCAGLVKQRQYPASAFMLTNAVGPHKLAEACDAAGARLIHVSTDCVFNQGGPHCECCVPDASDVYARSKLAGEVERAPHLTVRTSFVGFGPRGLIADMQNHGHVSASDKLLWSGHTVDAVADMLVTLAGRQDITGLLHIPGEFQNRWQLVQTLNRWLPGNVLISHDNSLAADRRLISDRWSKLGMPDLPDFAAQLETMRRP